MSATIEIPASSMRELLAYASKNATTPLEMALFQSLCDALIEEDYAMAVENENYELEGVIEAQTEQINKLRKFRNLVLNSKTITRVNIAPNGERFDHNLFPLIHKPVWRE